MTSNPYPVCPVTLPGPADRWFGLSEQLSFCSRRLQERLSRQSAEHGLNESQISLLWACLKAPAPGLSQNDLAEQLRISPAHVSGLVEQMRRRKLLKSRRDAADRRRQLWRGTEAGGELLHQILTAVADWAGQLDKHLTTTHVEHLAELIGRLIAALESLPAGDQSRGAAA